MLQRKLTLHSREPPSEQQCTKVVCRYSLLLSCLPRAELEKHSWIHVLQRAALTPSTPGFAAICGKLRMLLLQSPVLLQIIHSFSDSFLFVGKGFYFILRKDLPLFGM